MGGTQARLATARDALGSAMLRRYGSALRERMIPTALLGPGLAILAALFIYPIVANMVAMSFRSRYPSPWIFTWDRYVRFLTDPLYLKTLLTTLKLAATVTALTAVIGYPVAYYFVRGRSRYQHWVFLGIIFPLLVSVVVRTLGWIVVLGREGLVNSVLLGLGLRHEAADLLRSFWSVTVGMVHVLLPFMILSIASILGKIDRTWEEAAQSLGADEWRTFLRVTLPLSVPGIAAGAVIVFSLTLGAYVTPWMLARGRVQVLAMTIYDEALVLVDWPMAAVTSLMLTVVALGLLLVYWRAMRRWSWR
jgi:putative spermidine/putrescine transport system permease protein